MLPAMVTIWGVITTLQGDYSFVMYSTLLIRVF